MAEGTGYDVGSLFANVVPSFKGVQKLIDAESKKWASSISKNISDGISEGIEEGLDEGTKKSVPRSEKDGDTTAGHFASGFKKRLQAAFKDLPDAEINADSTAAEKKIAELRAKLKELSGKTVGVDIDPAQALAQIKVLQTQLNKVGRRSPNIQVKADTARAAAELAALKLEADRLNGRKINLSIAKQGLQSIGEAGSGISLLTLAIPALGIAAIPVMAALVAGAVALAGALGGAVLGIAALAAVAIPAIQHITKATADAAAANKKLASAQAAVVKAQQSLSAAKARQQAAATVKQAAATKRQASANTALAKAQKKVVAAQSSLATAKTPSSKKAATSRIATAQGSLSTAKTRAGSAGSIGSVSTASVAAATQRLATANKNLAIAKQESAKADAEMTPQEKLLSAATKTAKTAFSDWAKVLEPQVLPILTESLSLLNPVLKAVTPLVRGAADGTQVFLSYLADFVTSPWFSRIMEMFASLARESIPALGKAFLNIITGIGNLIAAFRPFTTVVLDGLDSVTQKFADWSAGLAQSSGFKSFMSYVTTNAPKVFKLIGDIAGAVIHIVKALAPFGPPLVAGFDALADAVKRIPTGVIRGFALAIGGFLVVLKGASTINTFAGAIGNVGTAFSNVQAGIKGIGSVIKTSAGAIGGFVTTMGSLAKTGAVTALSGVKAGIVSIVSGIANSAKTIGVFIASIVTMGVEAGITALSFVGLKLAQLGSAIVTGVATAAQWLLNAAVASFEVLTAPITLVIFGVIAAVAALGFGIFELVKHWTAVWGAIKAVATAIGSWFANTFAPFFEGIGRAIAGFFTGPFVRSFSTAGHAVMNALSAVASWFKNVFAGTFENVGRSIGGFFTGPFVRFFSGAWATIKKGAAAIGSWFSGTFVGFFKTGINDVLKAVNWLIRQIDKVLKFFHLPTISEIQLLSTGGPVVKNAGSPAKTSPGGLGEKLSGHRAGGILHGPGTGTSDSIMGVSRSGIPTAMVSTGEYVVNARSTAAFLPLLTALNSAGLPGHRSGGEVGSVPGFSVGGILGGIGHIASSVWSGITDAASWIGGSVSGIYGHLDNTVKGLLGAGNPVGGVGIGVIKQIISGAIKSITGAGGSGGGVIPTGQHLSLINAALSADGIPQPMWGLWERGLNTLIGRESGWNASAINRTDSNARAGHPSQGLAQTIPSTFAAFRNSSLPNNILNPVANIAASINYILSRYGSISNVQQANPNLPPKGYSGGGLLGGMPIQTGLFDTGGLLMPGITMAVNGTGSPEAIMNRSQWSAITSDHDSSGPQITQIINPSTGMSEIAVANISKSKLEFAMR